MSKKRGLGRGLSDLGLNELLSSINTHHVEASSQQRNNSDGLSSINVQHIKPGRYQPRRDFDTQGLEELAESIRSQGIIQPIIVRQLHNDQYEIIAGERRWRAAKLAGLDVVPAVIRDIPDDAAIAIGLIENIQRQNLNAIEEAIALQRLNEEFSLTHQEIAKVVGKSRATITNLLRLLSLPDDIKELVIKGELEMGHARALLALEAEPQKNVAKIIIEKRLSVREAEDYIRAMQNLNVEPEKRKKDPETHRLEKDLSKKIGAKVIIKHKDHGGGKLVIHYKNQHQMKTLLDYFD